MRSSQGLYSGIRVRQGYLDGCQLLDTIASRESPYISTIACGLLQFTVIARCRHEHCYYKANLNCPYNGQTRTVSLCAEQDPFERLIALPKPDPEHPLEKRHIGVLDKILCSLLAHDRRRRVGQKFSIIHMFMACLLSKIARCWPSRDGKAKHALSPRHFRSDVAFPCRSTYNNSVPPGALVVTKNPF
jgi:hypothetical protein